MGAVIRLVKEEPTTLGDLGVFYPIERLSDGLRGGMAQHDSVIDETSWIGEGCFVSGSVKLRDHSLVTGKSKIIAKEGAEVVVRSSTFNLGTDFIIDECVVKTVISESHFYLTTIRISSIYPGSSLQIINSEFHRGGLGVISNRDRPRRWNCSGDIKIVDSKLVDVYINASGRNQSIHIINSSYLSKLKSVTFPEHFKYIMIYNSEQEEVHKNYLGERDRYIMYENELI